MEGKLAARLSTAWGLSQSFLLLATNPFLLSPQPARSSPPQALPLTPKLLCHLQQRPPTQKLSRTRGWASSQPQPPAATEKLLWYLAELPNSSGGRGPHPCGHCLRTLHDGSRPEAAEVPALLTPTCPHLHQGRKIGKATEGGVRITNFHLEPSPRYQSPRFPCSSFSNRGLSGPTQPEAIQNRRRFFI